MGFPALLLFVPAISVGESSCTAAISIGGLSRAAMISSPRPKFLLLHSLGMACHWQCRRFHPEAESFSTYVEWVEMFFTANSIPNEYKELHCSTAQNKATE